jgi:hypothetical protein
MGTLMMMLTFSTRTTSHASFVPAIYSPWTSGSSSCSRSTYVCFLPVPRNPKERVYSIISRTVAVYKSARTSLHASHPDLGNERGKKKRRRRESSHPVLARSTTPSSAITTLTKHPSSSSRKMQQMVPTGLAIALFWGFVIAALNDDPVSIDKKQIAVKTLASEVEAARAEVIKQREAAAAYAATLHAAHAEALAVLNESRREDAAAAEKRFAEADEAHAAEVDLIRTRASREKRRLSWAFSASKALLAENNAAIQADHARMKKRFDNRDSRDDDVEKLAELTAEVRALDRVNAHLRGETEAFSRELDNRDQNDSIFGGCGSMRSSPGQGARKTTGGRSPMRSTGGRTPPSGVSSPLSTTSLSLERAKSFP